MKKILISISIVALIGLSSCGPGKPDKGSTGDTTSTSDAVNKANGAGGLKDSVGKKVAGDTTANGKPKQDSTSRPVH